jgi:hypothetical protein
MGHPDRGYPQMVPFNPRVGTPLTEKWQWFLINQQIYLVYGISNFDALVEDPKYNWRRLTKDQRDNFTQWFNSMYDDHRFWTNGAGVNNCRNYITGERMDKPLPKAWEVACAVNTIELTSTKRIAKQDTEWYELKTLDGSKDPPPLSEVNFQKTPQYIHTAVTWVYNSINKTFRTDDFPQMSNAFGFNRHSLYPIVSPGGKVLVETSRVSILPQGQMFTNPFEI